MILRQCAGDIVEGWLARAKQSSDLNVVPLSDEQRAAHVPRLVEDLALRLSKSTAAMKDSDAIFSAAAVAHMASCDICNAILPRCSWTNRE